MVPDSENMTELNLIQDSRKGVRKYSTGHYFDVHKDVHENSSTGLLSCVSSTGNPTYNTSIAAGTQCHNMVCTKMTKMDYFFCPFCYLYPVEYVFDLNFFPFFHVCSTCVLRKNIYYKNMFRELHLTSNREHDKG